MNPFFSVYLELARIFATLVVFFTHGKVFYQPLYDALETMNIGRDAVMIFFVLSGYVITWCANEREKTLMEFGINRASRIYSVAIPGLILGILVSIYISCATSEPITYQLHKPWLYLPIYLTFTGSFWNLTEIPPDNFPYWSLDYEVWYYIIFASFFYINSWLRWLCVFGLLILVGPNIALLFTVWVAGSALYYLQNRVKLSSKAARIIFLSTFIAYFLIKLTQLDNVLDSYNQSVWFFLFNHKLNLPNLAGYYLIGFLVVINFLAASKSKFSFSITAANFIRYSASYSFSFYLFHAPLYTVFQHFVKQGNSFGVYLAVLFFTALIIIFLAKFTEHKKSSYRAFFRKVIHRLKRAKLQIGNI